MNLRSKTNTNSDRSDNSASPITKLSNDPFDNQLDTENVLNTLTKTDNFVYMEWEDPLKERPITF